MAKAKPSWRLERLKHDVDEHVQILLECEGRPSIGFSIANWHGRRGVFISIDGMGYASLLLDTEHLGPMSNRIAKFCPYCGEELVLISSRSHSCPDDDEPGPLLAEVIRLRDRVKELEGEDDR